MTIKVTPETKVRRDAHGVVRQLSHGQSLYKSATPNAFAAGAVALTPRTLAEEYLRDASGLFQFAPAMTANLAAAASFSPTSAGVELRFKEEKALENAVTVSYDQTALGLPIWGAGVTVRIHGSEMGVTGSHNAAHYNVDAVPPSPGAQFLPHAMDDHKVAAVLQLPEGTQLTVNSTRPIIYRYLANERFDPQVEVHQKSDDSTGFAGTASRSFPTLELAAVPQSIIEGKHYVVTEVMFTFPFEGWGPINWRAFIEPESGAVLYLRALVSCAMGAVFASDPVTISGVLHSATSPVNVLDGLRTMGPLLGLSAATPGGGPQQLQGEFVRLVNLENPPRPMPSELPPHTFDYSCNTANFAACSAYHHCDGFFRLIAGMGIDVATYFNNTDFPIRVDPHARDNDVNAACNGNTMGNGIGPVVFGLAQNGTQFGIAADVRVVIHEFGHGVLWDHVDSPNFGWAHSPGDTLAVILHDPSSQAPDRFETFPFMKESAGLTRRHDRRPEQGWAWGGARDDTQYGSEQILSTTLFRVYRAAGGDSADPSEKAFASRYVAYLILKGVSFLQFTTRDPDVYVSALTDADATTAVFEGHPGGAFSKIFRWSFEKQGLYQPLGAAGPVTTPGAPPDVDVFIDDGRRGEYMPFQEIADSKPEIWNRNLPDGNTVNQKPIPGAVNYAYVRVRNRGTSDATEVVVRCFQSKMPGASVWPSHWRPATTAKLAASDIPSQGDVVVGPFQWAPQFDGEQLLFGVSSLGDRSNIETITAGPIANERLVRLDNNTAQQMF